MGGGVRMRGLGAKLFWGKYVLKMTTHGASLSLAFEWSVTEKMEDLGKKLGRKS